MVLPLPSAPQPYRQRPHFRWHFCINSEDSPQYVQFVGFWFLVVRIRVLASGLRLPLPNSFDQKLKLYFGVAPTGKRRQRRQQRVDRDMFSATAAAATKAFSHKEPPISRTTLSSFSSSHTSPVGPLNVSKMHMQFAWLKRGRPGRRVTRNSKQCRHRHRLPLGARSTQICFCCCCC